MQCLIIHAQHAMHSIITPTVSPKRRHACFLTHLRKLFVSPNLILFWAAWLAALPRPGGGRAGPGLARMPVIERIVSAPVFEEPLTWVGDNLPGDEESEALWVGHRCDA